MIDISVSFDDIIAAQNIIQPVARRTPVMTSRTANDRLGGKLFFKCENFQRVGAFKFRGAYNAISRLPGPQSGEQQNDAGVIAYSSGNHAQGVALAARLLGKRALILMQHDAPSIKIDATRDYGADIVFYNRHTEDYAAIGQQLQEEQNLRLIPAFDDPHVIAGQGTVAKELLDDVRCLDMLVAPLGGGGLLSGSAIAAKALNPNCVVIGVEPKAGDDGLQSLRSGQIVRIDPPKTIADGAQTRQLGHYTFPIIKNYVDDIVTVSDNDLVETMRFFADRMKMVVEPTGCLAAAAAFPGQISVSGKNVGVIISGGNVDIMNFTKLVEL